MYTCTYVSKLFVYWPVVAYIYDMRVFAYELLYSIYFHGDCDNPLLMIITAANNIDAGQTVWMYRFFYMYVFVARI